jgi:hypothetical protein
MSFLESYFSSPGFMLNGQKSDSAIYQSRYCFYPDTGFKSQTFLTYDCLGDISKLNLDI